MTESLPSHCFKHKPLGVSANTYFFHTKQNGKKIVPLSKEIEAYYHSLNMNWKCQVSLGISNIIRIFFYLEPCKIKTLLNT